MAHTMRIIRRFSPPPKRTKTYDLHEELAQVRLKVGTLEQELQDPWGRVSNYPWDMALKDQELRRAQVERHATNQAAFVARREMKGIRHAYFYDSLRRCRCIGAVVLSDFVFNF
ncbi:hypothetical protein LIER_42514 [Lithospermum erythrorhizon]|uniref:Uncharacterized protein n=1 Tax=Lithospermum erythrorhizon TaxID=34254 RepID=A0AAV3RT65_LITER